MSSRFFYWEVVSICQCTSLLYSGMRGMEKGADSGPAVDMLGVPCASIIMNASPWSRGGFIGWWWSMGTRSLPPHPGYSQVLPSNSPDSRSPSTMTEPTPGGPVVFGELSAPKYIGCLLKFI